MKKTAPALFPLLVAVALTACGRRPEAVPPDRPPSTIPPAPKMKPLPDTGFKVEWVGRPDIPATVPVRKTFPAIVTVKNTSDQVWLDPKNSDATNYAAGAVRLGYRWWKASGATTLSIGNGEARGDLLEPLPPGASASLTVQVAAPAEPGDYQLQLDLCQEWVSWFEPKGAATLVVPVKVK